MVKFIRASVDAIASRFDVPIENVIEVVFEYAEVESVAASESSIEPLSQKPKGGTEADRVYNEDAVNQYRAFCKEVYQFVEERGEIFGEDIYSPKSMSYYFTFFPKDSNGKMREKYMIFIRISDHKLPENQEEFVNNLRDDMFQMYKQPGTSLKDGIRQFDVLVNGKKYTSYETALSDTKKRLIAFLKRNK